METRHDQEMPNISKCGYSTMYYHVPSFLYLIRLDKDFTDSVDSFEAFNSYFVFFLKLDNQNYA